MSNNNERIKVVEDLLDFKQPLEELRKKLAVFPWDYEGKEAILTHNHLVNIQKLFDEDKLSIADVEEWANLIECRDDVMFENEVVEEKLYELANPQLN